MKSKTVCIIPARGGSKRLPKKNIMDFFGKPMIAWTIEAAIKSGCFDSVVVSTDSEEIAEISKSFGAEVPFLRTDKNDDISPVSEATLSTVKQLKNKLNLDYHVTVQLMANCPLRNEYDIKTAVDNFFSKNLNFQLSSFKLGWMNPWWSFKIASNGKPTPTFPEMSQMRSQDLPTLYCPTGAIWIAKTEELIRAGSFYGPGYESFPMDMISALDIDDQDDLMMAEAFYLVREKRKQGESQQ